MDLIIIAALAISAGIILFSRMSLGNSGNSPFNKRNFTLIAIIIFTCAFAVRLIFAFSESSFEVDINLYKAWARVTNEVGFGQVYSEDLFLDYPPGYLYVLVLLEKIRLFFNIDSASMLFTAMIKMPSILADLFCAWAILHIAKIRLDDKNALFLSAAYLLCPAVIINSAAWGQTDSFCTAILLVSLFLLYKEKYISSAVLYGISIICKPQMLIFAPLFIFYMLKKKCFKQLLLGIVSALAAILLIATPFTQNFNYLWLIDRYTSTMNYYAYYSLNAYNIWGIFKLNWRGLPEPGFMLSFLTVLGPILATAFSAVIVYMSKRKDVIFIVPAVLMSTVYMFTIKMHERYLFPSLLFILIAYIWARDKRLLYSFTATSLIHFLNVYVVLTTAINHGNSYDPNAPHVMILSILQTLVYFYFIYVVFSVYVKDKIVLEKVRVVNNSNTTEEKKITGKLKVKTIMQKEVDSKFKKTDFIAITIITLVYAAFGLSALGVNDTAQTAWTPYLGESVVFEAEGEYDELVYIPIVSPDKNHYLSVVGNHILIEVSNDAKTWIESATVEETGVYAWRNAPLAYTDKYIRLTALDESVSLGEIAIRKNQQEELAVLKSLYDTGNILIDEQEKVPQFNNYYNSSYFDEIYHPRTAYENLLWLEIYENTHPPLGKLIISVGIAVFGMNPFGWRIMGALFGILMLPVLYHLLKQLFGKTSFCVFGTLLFAFDFMHFAQTRLATIDTYAVFFLMLMFDAMVCFMKKDLDTSRIKKLLVPLAFCGIFTGLGIAAKWNVAYGAFGLAALFFIKLGVSLYNQRANKKKLNLLITKCLELCLWCILFFCIVPFIIYFITFLPMTTLPHNVHDIWGSFMNYQTTMFDYHSTLVAEHPYSSPWYEWPFIIKPIWYSINIPTNSLGEISTIVGMGNPALWWSAVPAFIAAFILFIKKKERAALISIVAFFSVYLPWTVVSRITFIYHYFTAIPFLIIAIVYVFMKLSEHEKFSKTLAVLVVSKNISVKINIINIAMITFVIVNIALFIAYLPVISGFPTTSEYTDTLEWLSSWRFS